VLAGKAITIGSRDAVRADEAANRLRTDAEAAGHMTPRVDGQENTVAAASAPVVVIAVPLAAQIATIKSIREHLRPGAILIDVTVPVATAIGGRASRMLGLPSGSAAEQLAEYAPEGVQVVSAFHFLSADVLADAAQSLDCDVVACGGNAAAQEVVRELALTIPNVHYIHAGPLIAARLVEAAATMVIAINVRHKVRHSGLRITGLV
jgi:NADPH-dependent F420 reductase